MNVDTIDREPLGERYLPGVDVHRYGEITEDPALVAVLRGKPAHGEIAQTTWWLVADSLRFSVYVRRWAQGVPELDDDQLRRVADRARRLAFSAWLELMDAPGAAPASDAPIRTRVSVAKLRISMRELGRLVVSPRVITAARLRMALETHLQALDGVLPSGPPAFETSAAGR
jgi:hypothetical protein